MLDIHLVAQNADNARTADGKQSHTGRDSQQFPPPPLELASDAHDADHTPARVQLVHLLARTIAAAARRQQVAARRIVEPKFLCSAVDDDDPAIGQ